LLADYPWPLPLVVLGKHFQLKTTCIRFGKSHRVKSSTYLSKMPDSGLFWIPVIPYIIKLIKKMIIVENT
jgi:hypothetical protein